MHLSKDLDISPEVCVTMHASLARCWKPESEDPASQICVPFVAIKHNFRVLTERITPH